VPELVKTDRVHNKQPPQKVEEGLGLTVAHTECAGYRGPVYNLEVEEDNTYVASGYVVHNCDNRPICLAQSRENQVRILHEEYTTGIGTPAHPGFREEIEP